MLGASDGRLSSSITRSKQNKKVRSTDIIFKSERCPPQHSALTPFENELYDLAKDIKFRKVTNEFQNQLTQDIKNFISLCIVLAPIYYIYIYIYIQRRSTPTSGPPPKVSARAPAHRSYHFRGVKLKSCIKKIHHNLYISKQANVRIKHADTEGSSHKKFGTDARVQ